MTDAFNEKSASFVDWFQSATSTSLSKKVQLADLRSHGGGRGVVATADIDENEDLFTLPRSLVLSAETSRLSSLHPQIFTDLDPWISLILVLIYELLQGDYSPWAPYLAVLPREFDTLMFWSQDELVELQASAVRRKIGKEEADSAFKEKVVPVVRSHAAAFFARSPREQSDDEILALAHWAGSAIMAYAFDIEKNESEREEDDDGYVSEDEDEALPKGMVPMADMLNADAERNNARLFYGAANLTMKALKPIKAGEEILNDCEALPRADMVKRYGYFTPNYAQYDVVEVSRELIFEEMLLLGHSEGQIEEKMMSVEGHGLFEDGYDIVHPSETGSCFTSDLLGVLNILCLPSEALYTTKSTGKISTKMTAEVARLLDRVIRKRLAQYATSVDEDKTILADATGSRRKRMAVEVRLGEKRVLEMAQAELDNVRRTLGIAGTTTAKRTPPNGEIAENRKRRKGG